MLCWRPARRSTALGGNTSSVRAGSSAHTWIQGPSPNHLVDLLEANDTVEFPAVFEAVERLLVEGDPGIRYLVTFGLIEGIQNVSSNRHGRPFAARFRPWLGSNTANAWDHVHRLWGTTDA